VTVDPQPTTQDYSGVDRAGDNWLAVGHDRSWSLQISTSTRRSRLPIVCRVFISTRQLRQGMEKVSVSLASDYMAKLSTVVHRRSE
jgi:hypothetical protein